MLLVSCTLYPKIVTLCDWQTVEWTSDSTFQVVGIQGQNNDYDYYDFWVNVENGQVARHDSVEPYRRAMSLMSCPVLSPDKKYIWGMDDYSGQLLRYDVGQKTTKYFPYYGTWNMAIDWEKEKICMQINYDSIQVIGLDGSFDTMYTIDMIADSSYKVQRIYDIQSTMKSGVFTWVLEVGYDDGSLAGDRGSLLLRRDFDKNSAVFVENVEGKVSPNYKYFLISDTAYFKDETNYFYVYDTKGNLLKTIEF